MYMACNANKAHLLLVVCINAGCHWRFCWVTGNYPERQNRCLPVIQSTESCATAWSFKRFVSKELWTQNCFLCLSGLSEVNNGLIWTHIYRNKSIHRCRERGVCEVRANKSERERTDNKVSSIVYWSEKGQASCMWKGVFSMCACVCVCVGGMWCRGSGTPCALPGAGRAVKSCWAIDGFLKEKTLCHIIAKEISKNTFIWFSTVCPELLTHTVNITETAPTCISHVYIKYTQKITPTLYSCNTILTNVKLGFIRYAETLKYVAKLWQPYRHYNY